MRGGYRACVKGSAKGLDGLGTAACRPKMAETTSPLNISLILELTKRDFVERFAGSSLGAAWAFIWPLVNLVIYIVIFSQIMGARLPGHSNVYSYGVYLTAGLIPWTAFAGTFSRSSQVFLEKRNLISKIRLSLPALLLFVSLAESVTFAITMGFFFIFLLATGFPLNPHLILLPFIYFLQQMLAFGLGLLFATFMVFIRDLKEVVGILLQLWFWMTPIVYVKDILPEPVKPLMIYNPAYAFIESYQRLFIFQDTPHLGSLVVLTVLAHLVTLGAYGLFRKLEKDIRDFL
ncbi:MAG: ABC transporter permease [Thermodesulfobacteriota bacterium]|nr:ABC transporter permease [Thermodesulfobacteriota bacterium]